MNQNSWEVVVLHSFLLGESPLWNKSKKHFYWVDILQNYFHRFSHEQGIHHIHKLEGLECGSEFYWRIRVAVQNRFAVVEVEKASQKIVACPEAHLTNNRFYDGKCGPAGRFWVGTMAMSGQPDPGTLYVLEKDLSVSSK